MTVAAIIIADGTDPLAEAVGRPAVRRIVDSAWAGGALPIIIVADGDGVADAVAGSPAIVIDRGADAVASWRAGVAAAREAVAETTGHLLWPLSMTWVDPETVTSLIESTGRDRDSPVRPILGDVPGWPLVMPDGVADDLALADDPAGGLRLVAEPAGLSTVELGDPGTTTGIDIALDALPPYQGPPEPVGGPPPEWGAAAADTSDD